MQKECWNGTVISDVNAYKDYLMMVNATPVLVRLVREVPKDRGPRGPLQPRVVTEMKMTERKT